MKTLLTAVFAVALISGCKNDDPDPVNEEELITTVRLTFTATTGGSPVVVEWKDADGDGSGAPVAGSATLSANRTYAMTVQILNESVTPAENITEEIEEEDEDHQFFFTKPAALNLTVTYADADADGKPIGLTNAVTTGAASSGTLQVTLRHLLNKSGANVSAGNPANAGGETDIETLPPFNIT
ncbi:MAG: type 1 periplasmic binding fold superfamily protein, partial [Ferruginibacter sp.]|nr:type 1 periplasmic binding fold superfamily protein [Cytophagales bacterium]